MADSAEKVAPDHYKLVLENDKLRVLEYKDKPGDKTELHSHSDMVVYVVKGGKYRFTSPGGESLEIETAPGLAMYQDASEHTTENIGTGETHAVMIELK